MGFYYLDIFFIAAAAVTCVVSATNAATDDPFVLSHPEYNISGLVMSDPPSEVEHLPFLYSKHVCDPAIATIMAWLVLVIGLEIHDFHYHIKLAFASSAVPVAVATTNDIIDDDDDDENDNYGGVKKIHRRMLSTNDFVSDDKYIASLEAVRLGLHDAIVDAIIVYSVMYAIVIGMTWSDVEPNFLLVIQGVAYIVSAGILTSTGWKIPQWLGLYRKSKFNILKDTSDRASQAVMDHVVDGTASLSEFRYQVRLGVGKHTFTFGIPLLPFYISFKPWFLLFSIFIGLTCGHLYQFIVLKCRKKFKKNVKKVVFGASVVAILLGSVAFASGISFIDTVWNWYVVYEEWKIILMSFFSWTILCLGILGIYYHEQKVSGVAEVDASQEKALVVVEKTDDSHVNEVKDAVTQNENVDSDTGLPKETVGRSELEDQSNINRRQHFKKESFEHHYYESVYFDRVTLVAGKVDERRSKQIYNRISASEKINVKWYHRLWRAIPLLPAWHIFRHRNNLFFNCCRKDSEFFAQPCHIKSWHIVVNFLRILGKAAALFVTIVACGATYQTKVAKSKFDESFEISYAKQNIGKVCAFDEPNGIIRTFPSKDDAHAANFSIAHCGQCAACSTWNDMEVQYTTRHDLALRGRKCAQKTIMGGTTAAFDCIEATIGFKGDCARCWVGSFTCSRNFCAFIFLQSAITNRIANFEVSPDTITSAQCSEASCEAGNPGPFVACSGSNRRKMNIKSDIKRPSREQCTIVDVERTVDTLTGDIQNDWGLFFSTN